MKWFIGLLTAFAFAGSAIAADSEYTNIELETGCIYYDQYEQGGRAYCSGLKGYPVHFTEGDLRHMVQFGHIGSNEGQWESFSQFNYINDAVEWRLSKNIPYAAILRWFVENSDENGAVSEGLRGQVLVVSSVASHANPVSCVVGYVDARANKNANAIARNVADKFAKNFVCGKDKAVYHGKRGKFSGEPVSSFQ